MKKQLEINIQRNNLTYFGKGYAHFLTKDTSDTFNDDGRIVTIHDCEIDLDIIELHEVTVFDADEIPIYEGKGLDRHYKFFEQIVRDYDIDFSKDYLNIEL